MHLFFDLDGTLTDSAPGIVRCVNFGLASVGCQEVTEERIRAMIGTPLSAIYQTIVPGCDAAFIDRAVAAYRQRFNDVGIFENSLFPGAAEALQAFRDRGYSLAIVTSKVAVAAQRVIEHFQIAEFFTAVHGPGLDERTSHKSELLGRALAAAAGPRSRMAMIGDRKEDMAAAADHGMRGVGAAWGYGVACELSQATLVARTWPEAVAGILS